MQNNFIIIILIPALIRGYFLLNIKRNLVKVLSFLFFFN